MSNLNQCNFIGRLGKDPETKFLPGGDAVTNMSIAISEKYKDKSGLSVEKTEWVRIVAFRRLAEVMGEYLKKGSLVYVSGKMTTRKWQDQSGQDKYSTEIVASQMTMLDSKGSQPHQSSSPQVQHQNLGQPNANAKDISLDDMDSVPF